MIPVTSSSVNVDDLHPTLRLRVDAMLADPRMAGYRVVSGVRSYELQKSLYSGWRKRLAGVPGFGHYNNAANPDAYGSPTFDGLRFRGSYHMVQDDGYGHAVDLRAPVSHSTAKRWQLVGAVGAEYGLRQTVAGEWWHLQARDRSHWFHAPRIAKPVIPTPSPDLDTLGPPRMIITYGFFVWLNEGWRYRQLSSPGSVESFKAGGGFVWNLTDEPATLRALLNEARTAGRLVQGIDADRLLDELNRG